MDKYENMSYLELSEAAIKANPKELRKIHKIMRKRGYGGFRFFDRYPQLPLIISIISLILVYFKPAIIGFFQ